VINDEEEQIDPGSLSTAAGTEAEEPKGPAINHTQPLQFGAGSRLAELFKKGNRIELDEFEALNIKTVVTRKEVKNISSLRSLVSSYEDRCLAFVEINQELFLVVLKRWNATATETKKKISQLATRVGQGVRGGSDDQPSANPYESENPYDMPANTATPSPQPAAASPLAPVFGEDIIMRPHWVVKSITQLSRIFMIDITSKGIFKVQIQLTMHFVNKSKNPGSAPKIKSYFFSNDVVNHTN